MSDVDGGQQPADAPPPGGTKKNTTPLVVGGVLVGVVIAGVVVVATRGEPRVEPAKVEVSQGSALPEGPWKLRTLGDDEKKAAAALNEKAPADARLVAGISVPSDVAARVKAADSPIVDVTLPGHTEPLPARLETAQAVVKVLQSADAALGLKLKVQTMWRSASSTSQLVDLAPTLAAAPCNVEHHADGVDLAAVTVDGKKPLTLDAAGKVIFLDDLATPDGAARFGAVIEKIEAEEIAASPKQKKAIVDGWIKTAATDLANGVWGAHDATMEIWEKEGWSVGHCGDVQARAWHAQPALTNEARMARAAALAAAEDAKEAAEREAAEKEGKGKKRKAAKAGKEAKPVEQAAAAVETGPCKRLDATYIQRLKEYRLSPGPTETYVASAEKLALDNGVLEPYLMPEEERLVNDAVNISLPEDHQFIGFNRTSPKVAGKVDDPDALLVYLKLPGKDRMGKPQRPLGRYTTAEAVARIAKEIDETLGVKVRANFLWRSNAVQHALRTANAKLAAPPGRSNHFVNAADISREEAAGKKVLTLGVDNKIIFLPDLHTPEGLERFKEVIRRIETDEIAKAKGNQKRIDKIVDAWVATAEADYNGGVWGMTDATMEIWRKNGWTTGHCGEISYESWHTEPIGKMKTCERFDKTYNKRIKAYRKTPPPTEDAVFELVEAVLAKPLPSAKAIKAQAAAAKKARRKGALEQLIDVGKEAFGKLKGF